jgi:transcriptional regulator GlxA family with amidase domain
VWSVVHGCSGQQALLITITDYVCCNGATAYAAKEGPVKRYPLLLVVSLMVFLIASISTASGLPKAVGEPITVGILLLNKPFITEFAGPLDVYHHVPAEKIRVFIVSDTDKEQVTYEGMPFRANYTIGNAPKIDVLVVPSGAGSLDADQKNVPVINWIKKAAREAKFITSHCEGAFLLGKAGLLDNKDATTFPADTGALQTQYPSCRIQTDRRVVVDGNLITSPGGLASYEASLYVVEQLFGKDQALTIASALLFGPSNIEAAITTK